MTPIFIITCDRLEILKQSIQSYRDCIKTPFEIVVVDFGSTYPPTIGFLKQLEQGGVKVYWKKRINHVTELNTVNVSIQDYFKSHPASDYVVTDPDIALDAVQGNVLGVYDYFLKTFPTINVAGPMLRIDDIPAYYTFRTKILNGEMGMHKGFHSQTIHNIVYEGNEVRYIFAPIDTTFGMYRAETQWARLSMGVRLFAPYSARHLDWYTDPGNLTPDQVYYIEHASKQIAHWCMQGE